jgi:diacylglycerol kinase family enzyme
MSNVLVSPNAPLHILFNAASGSGDAERARSDIAEILDRAGRAYEFFPIDQPRQTAETARRAVNSAAHNGGAVIAAGGDGTVNAAIEAVLPMELPFGIVPRGTFNYSARAHGIPLETRAAVESLLSARIKPVQVGLVNERVFFVNASLGMYPQLLQDREMYKKQFGRKRLIALWAGLATLLRHRSQLVLEIEHDREREIVRTPTLFVGNNPLQLEQIGLPEARDVEQRRLAAVIVKPVSSATLVWLAIRGALGRLGEDDRVRDFSFKRMHVKPFGLGRGKVKVATDGEICWLSQPVTFSVAPKSLMLMVPDGAEPE